MIRAAEPGAPRGTALVTALLLVVTLGAITAALTRQTRLQADAGIEERARARSLHAAEGGLRLARWALQRDPAYAGETLEVGGTEVRVRVRRAASGAGTWLVEARARCWPRGRRGTPRQACLHAAVVRRGGSLLLRPAAAAR